MEFDLGTFVEEVARSHGWSDEQTSDVVLALAREGVNSTYDLTLMHEIDWRDLGLPVVMRRHLMDAISSLCISLGLDVPNTASRADSLAAAAAAAASHPASPYPEWRVTDLEGHGGGPTFSPHHDDDLTVSENTHPPLVASPGTPTMYNDPTGYPHDDPTDYPHDPTAFDVFADVRDPDYTAAYAAAYGDSQPASETPNPPSNQSSSQAPNEAPDATLDNAYSSSDDDDDDDDVHHVHHGHHGHHVHHRSPVVPATVDPFASHGDEDGEEWHSDLHDHVAGEHSALVGSMGLSEIVTESPKKKTVRKAKKTKRVRRKPSSSSKGSAKGSTKGSTKGSATKGSAKGSAKGKKKKSRADSAAGVGTPLPGSIDPVPDHLLPSGWECKLDVQTSRYYFIDHINKTTSWTPPIMSEQEQPPPIQPRTHSHGDHGNHGDHSDHGDHKHGGDHGHSHGDHGNHGHSHGDHGNHGHSHSHGNPTSTPAAHAAPGATADVPDEEAGCVIS